MWRMFHKLSIIEPMHVEGVSMDENQSHPDYKDRTRVIVVIGVFLLLFGVFLFGFKGILLLEITIMCLIFLIWGTLRLRMWAWWGSMAYLSVITFSTILTLVLSSYSTILSGLEFPRKEIEFLGGLPVQGCHFAVLAGIPLLITWVVAILSKRHFRRGAVA